MSIILFHLNLVKEKGLRTSIFFFTGKKKKKSYACHCVLSTTKYLVDLVNCLIVN